jgi:hypothetical protein
MYHLIHEHSIGDTSPPIPGQLLVHIFITKEEQMVLCIQKQVTTSWRRQDNIPGSDGFRTYLTQYLQLNLTSIIEKDTS